MVDFAATGLADQSQRLAFGDREAHIVDRMHALPRSDEEPPRIG
jgi:hypothetical protein